MHRTDIRGADLSGARGLTQGQIRTACGDGSTRLPGGLTAQACRSSAITVIRTPPAPPVPPRVRNFVAVAGN